MIRHFHFFRHVLVKDLQPADGPSVRAKVCSDLRAGSAEVTAEIASSDVTGAPARAAGHE